MSPDLLRQIGEALFGDRWQTQLSRALDVSDRTVRRWLAGEPPKPGVAANLRRLLQDRVQALGDQVLKIDRALAAVIAQERAGK